MGFLVPPEGTPYYPGWVKASGTAKRLWDSVCHPLGLLGYRDVRDRKIVRGCADQFGYIANCLFLRRLVPRNAELATILHSSESSVARYNAWLKREGFLRITGRGPGVPAHYHLVWKGFLRVCLLKDVPIELPKVGASERAQPCAERIRSIAEQTSVADPPTELR